MILGASDDDVDDDGAPVSSADDVITPSLNDQLTLIQESLAWRQLVLVPFNVSHNPRNFILLN